MEEPMNAEYPLIHVLPAGTYLYKGVPDKSFIPPEYEHVNDIKWFAADPQTAELYAKQSGKVWIFRLNKNIPVFNINPTSIERLKLILNNLIDACKTNENEQVQLKVPFGLIDFEEQKSYIKKTQYACFFNTTKTAAKSSFQRLSVHQLDHLFTTFMLQYQDYILGKLTLQDNKCQIPTSQSFEIQGYYADPWKDTVWHYPKFHAEVCISLITNPLIPVAFYEFEHGSRKVTYYNDIVRGMESGGGCDGLSTLTIPTSPLPCDEDIEKMNLNLASMNMDYLKEKDYLPPCPNTPLQTGSGTKKYIKTSEKHFYRGYNYVIYKGPRGGKYIKRNRVYHLISRLK